MNIRDWEKEKEYLYFLQKVMGFARETVRKLVEYYGSAENVCEKSFEEIKERLGRLSEERKKIIRRSWNKECFEQVREEYRREVRGRMEYLPWYHPDYPHKLRQIPDAPCALFYRGKLPDEKKPALAIIGSRGCSVYGSGAAGWFGEEMAKNGVQVISGLARGIDSIAQKAALDAGGTSFGILGCGADVCYPRENQIIYDQCIKNGGILSEYFPHTQPDGKLFPPRNRIISGLSDAVLVVEARKRSGTLITVDMALDQGRDVFMLPGRVTDKLSEGCNKMISQGAEMALSPEDLLEKLYGIRKKQEENREEAENEEDATPDLLSVLDLQPKSLERLFEELNTLRFAQGKEPVSSVMEVGAMLMEACLSGTAVQLPGGFYRLDDRLFGRGK
ncbi:MAG: DNA-processing protein DprA [Lachnospiraceae bacterium]|nr:DNA-processing protein DprA [Lachnospiraceae bacterium]